MSDKKKPVHVFQRPENAPLERAVSLLLSDDPSSVEQLRQLLEQSHMERDKLKQEKLGNNK